MCMGVSENGMYPQIAVLIGTLLIKHGFQGTVPHFQTDPHI